MEISLAPIVSDFYLDDSFVSLIIGPIGSGKTLGSIAKLDRLIHEQEPDEDGVRRSRSVIVRNTYLELKDTTIRSFQGFYGDLLKFNWGNLTATYKHNDVHAEFLFRSLDKPEDMRKLLSLEITYAYLNELRELPREALTNVTSRLGRFPYSKDGKGATKPMLFADSNACPDDHWMYELFLTDERPDNFKLFLQPPAILDDGSVNPKAENLDNLPYEYYRGQLSGKPQDWIDVMIKVKFISLQTGRPVYREYNDTFHCVDSKDIKPPLLDVPLICASDNGRWSGFVVGQVDTFGRLVVFDEITSDDISLTDFAEIIRSHMASHYEGYKFETWIDPWAANQRSQLNDMTMYKVFQKAGLHPRISTTKKPETMVEAVKKKLGTWTVGHPNIVISNKCKKLRQGLNGGYQYKRMSVSGEKYADKPDKGIYSHICNAFEFLVDGTGASREMLSGGQYKEPVRINTHWDAI